MFKINLLSNWKKYYNSALDFYKKKDYKRALELFEQAKKLEPKNYKIPYNMALCYQNLGEDITALNFYKITSYVLRI